MINFRKRKAKHPMNLLGLGLSISLIPAGTMQLGGDEEITNKFGGFLFIITLGRSRHLIRITI